VNKLIAIPLLITLTLLLTVAVAPTSAEHATCTPKDDESCGVIMNWGWIFDNTPSDFEGAYTGTSLEDRYGDPDDSSYDFGSVDDVERSEDLLGPTRSQHRSLYHGIWLNQHQPTANVMTGETEDTSIDDATPWISNTNNYRPPYITTEYQPNWWGVISKLGDEISYTEEGDTIKLHSSETKFEFKTWESEGSGFFGGGFWDTGDRAPIEESSWNADDWEFQDKFRPQYITFNGSVPDNSNIKIEVFELADDDDINDNPLNYKLGEINIDGDGGINGSTSTETFTEIVTHNSGSDFGLSDYKQPKYDEYGTDWWIIDTSGVDASTYHIRLTLEREDTDDPSPEIGLSETVTLSEVPPTYRVDHQPWGSYPQTMTTFNNDTEDRQLLSETNERRSGFGEILLGHSEDMFQNFEEEHIEGSSLKTSTAPKIPRDDLNNGNRFYHGRVADSSDYHVVEDYFMFHHAYSDIPRVERSFYYQKNYDTIESDDWNTTISDEGSVYALFDAATNDIPQKDLQRNSNFYYYDHESAKDRKYDSFNDDPPISLPPYSESSISDDQLLTNAVRLTYTLEELKIQPELGVEYFNDKKHNFLNDSDYALGNYPLSTSENFTEVEGIEEYYDEDKVLEEISEDYKGQNIDGFYSNISDLRVKYSIDYHRVNFVASDCPDHPGSGVTNIEDTDDDGDPDEADPVGSHSINDEYSGLDSNIHSDYTGYINAISPSKKRTPTEANGQKACSDPSHEYISGNYWDPASWSDVKDLVNHDNGTEVVYNASDSIIEGDVNDSSYLYEVDKIGKERANEQGPSGGDIGDSFDTKLAIGENSFGSKTHFNRDIQSDGVNETRWTRAEATATFIRNTQSFEQEGENRTARVHFRSDLGLDNPYYNSIDYSQQAPLPGEMVDNAEVYLDLYNYGPSTPDERLKVEYNGNTIYDSSLSDTESQISYNHLDRIDLTSQVSSGQDKLQFNFTYEGGSSATDEDYNHSNQRIDYVVTFETNRPLQDIYSRWGYNTFRDDRYDLAYEFTSDTCVTDVPECYEYEKHGIPFTTLEDTSKGEYDSDWQEQPPSEVNTNYPSKAMFVRPYLVPTTESVQTTDPTGIGHSTRAIADPADYITSNYDTSGSDNILGDSNIDTTVTGNIIRFDPFYDNSFINFGGIQKDKVKFMPVDYQDKLPPVLPDPEDVSGTYNENETYTFASEDIQHMMKYSDPETREQIQDNLGDSLQHVDTFDFPATSIKANSGFTGEPLSINYIDPGNMTSQDFDIEEYWFEDGRMWINVNMSKDVTGEDKNPVFKGRFQVRVLDFPTGHVGNWRDWGSIPTTTYEDGVMFGGHNTSNLDQLRASDEDFWTDNFDISYNPGVWEYFIPFTSDVEYYGNSEFWLIDSQKVAQDVNGTSSVPFYVNYMDRSPLSSNYCAKDHDNGERYCNTVVNNIASFNSEQAIVGDNTNHLNAGKVPVGTDVEKEPYLEFSQFEYDSFKNYKNWFFAGDASWETREANSLNEEQPYMFDTVDIELKRMENVSNALNSSEISDYQSSTVSHSFDTSGDDDREQYRVRITSSNGAPISFKERHNKISAINGLPALDSKSHPLKEGVCIETSGGVIGGSQECYLTDENGELYFYVESISGDDPKEVVEEVKVIGSKDKWWEYNEGYRMIESQSSSVSDFERNIDPPDGQLEGGLWWPLLILILIILFIFSLIMRVRPRPSTGPNTKELANTMFGAFVTVGIKRLFDMLLYVILISIGVTTLLAAFGDGSIDPFFVFNFILEEVVITILDIIF
jgi:hypothetical protein